MSRRKAVVDDDAREKVSNKRSVPSRHNGACEAELWTFTCPPVFLSDDNATEVHWVAAESLDAALEYMRRWHHDFIVTEARCLGMVPVLSGSPLD